MTMMFDPTYWEAIDTGWTPPVPLIPPSAPLPAPVSEPANLLADVPFWTPDTDSPMQTGIFGLSDPNETTSFFEPSPGTLDYTDILDPFNLFGLEPSTNRFGQGLSEGSLLGLPVAAMIPLIIALLAFIPKRRRNYRYRRNY